VPCRAGDFFQTILVHDAQASLEDDNYTHNLYDSPVWQEATAVYLQLAHNIPYLRQIQVLAKACSFHVVLWGIDPAGHMSEAMQALRQHLIITPDRCLEDARDAAQQLKINGDR
jgi:hypothetical protein